jgi:uncharacterized protein
MTATPPRLLLGHGASGTAASLRPHVDGLHRRGVEALAVDLPRGTAERAMPRFEMHLDAATAPVAVGGHSFGGRVASLVAAQRPVAALVLLSYPLHRPGHPETLRTEHWPRIACPVLLLSGDSDPFCRPDRLRESLPLLRVVTAHTWPGVGHGLTPVLDEALDRVAAFLKSLA